MAAASQVGLSPDQDRPPDGLWSALLSDDNDKDCDDDDSGDDDDDDDDYDEDESKS